MKLKFKIYTFSLCLLFSNFILAQEKTGYINHSQTIKRGSFTEYTLDIKMQYKAGLYKTNGEHSSLGLDIRIIDVRITNITFRGQNAKNLIGLNYPVDLKNPKLNIELNDYYNFNGKTYSDVHKKFYGMTNSYFGHYNNGGFHNFEKIFGSDASLDKTIIELKGIKVLNLYATETQSISDQLAQNYQKQVEIKELKKDLSISYNNKSIKELKDIRNKYVQLEKIEEKNYGKEIAEIDKKIAELEKENNQLKNETNVDNKNTESITKGNNQESGVEKRKRIDRENALKIRQETQDNIDRVNQQAEILGEGINKLTDMIFNKPKSQPTKKVLVETTYNIGEMQEKLWKDFDDKVSNLKNKVNLVILDRKKFFSEKKQLEKTYNFEGDKQPIYFFIAYSKKGYDVYNDKTDYENYSSIIIEYDIDAKLNFSPIYRVYPNTNGQYPFLKQILTDIKNDLALSDELFDIKYYDWYKSLNDIKKTKKQEVRSVTEKDFFKVNDSNKTINLNNENKFEKIDYWNTKN